MKKILFFLFMLFACVGVQAQCKRALVFGLGEQEDKSWGKINGDKDVDYALEMLAAMGYTDVVTLKNAQATKQGMVRAFIDLANRCRKGDVIYIHYSGHGQLMTDLDGDEALRSNASYARWDEAWIPYDAYMLYGKNDDGSKHFTDDEVAVCLTAVREAIGDNGELLVVVDACHSGDGTCGEEIAPLRGVGVKFNMPRNSSVQQVAEPVTEQWLTISACKPFQLNMEMSQPQVGKLTYALYMIGAGVFDLESEELQQRLTKFMEENKGLLPQTPVVSGAKKISK